MAPEALAQVLRPLHNLFHNGSNPPQLLVGLGVAGDDAAIYQLTPNQAIINTIDFFTPVVDDPYDYGVIAAANAMSDVYAMGGEVIFALNVGAFPASMEPAIIAEILRGGAEKVIEAGGVIAGGHTVTDDEPKYGLAVTGVVHPERFFTKGGAQPGDALVLTKPLGTGAISTALKGGIANPAHVSKMIETMKQLNRQASQAVQAVGNVKSATDITGFGLLGHALEMAEASACKFILEMNQIPLLDGAMAYAADFIFPGGMANNKMYFEKQVTFAPAIPEHQQWLLWDPQTSGGLLLAIPAAQLSDFQNACHADGRDQAMWVIGHVAAGRGIEVLP
ncbi:MAG: selenide, water dikinase SelD [Anaerolineae bacterium]|nr:selenide, water dikinase SelD [Anaerolineae bacterium]